MEKDEYYHKHLMIINPFLPIHLTPKEIEVLALFMSMTGDISKDRFGTTARKIVMEKLELSRSGLSNHMKSLKNKGFIKKDKILPILFPEENEQMYQFKIENIG